MKLFHVIFLFLVFGSCDTETDDEKIRSNRLASNYAIALHDTTTLSTYWTEDITVVTSRNNQNVNKHQYAAALGQEFKTKTDVVYVRTPDNIEVFPEWKMAAEFGHWTGSWKDGNENIEVTGTYYAKWHLVDGQWLIRAEIFTPLACEGGGFCDSVPKMQ